MQEQRRVLGMEEQEENLEENWPLGSMRKTHPRLKLHHALRCSFVFPQFSGDKRLTWEWTHTS